jgi:hypothetical protein
MPSSGQVSRVYVRPPNDLSAVTTFDWQGVATGVIRLPRLDTSGFPPSAKPAIQAVRSVSAQSGLALLEDDRIIDSSGTLRGRINPSLGFGAIWANDGAHICELTVAGFASSGPTPPAGDVRLQVLASDGSVNSYGVVGTLDGRSYPEIKACDVKADRAVVAAHDTAGKNGLAPVTGITVWQISTGKSLVVHDYSQGPQSPSIPVSADAQFIVLPTSNNTTASYQVVDTTTGRVAADLGSHNVMAFGGDGSLVVETWRDATQPGQEHVGLWNWKRNTVVWTNPGGSAGGVTAVCANASDMSTYLAIDEPTGPTLWLIDALGRGRAVTNDVGELYAFGPHM